MKKILICSAVEPGSTRVNKTGAWRTFKPIANLDLCTRCGICSLYCPEDAVYELENGYPAVNYNYCKGCGICANECPKKAIEMILEEK